MVERGPQPNGEGQPQQDPYAIARQEFRRTLHRGQDLGVLIGQIHNIHEVLAKTNPNEPVIVYERSIGHVDEALDTLGEGAENGIVPKVLSELQKIRGGYEIARNFLSAGPAVARPTQPTRTEALPPMTGAKGEQAPTPTGTSRSRTRQPQQAQPDAGAAAATGEPEKKDEAVGGEQEAELDFRGYVKQLRTDRKMSQGALGVKAGFGQTQTSAQGMFSQFERGGMKNVKPETVDKLVEALGLDEAETTKLRELYDKQFGTKEEQDQ